MGCNNKIQITTDQKGEILTTEDTHSPSWMEGGGQCKKGNTPDAQKKKPLSHLTMAYPEEKL